jgi:hypothetical protein
VDDRFGKQRDTMFFVLLPANIPLVGSKAMSFVVAAVVFI